MDRPVKPRKPANTYLMFLKEKITEKKKENPKIPIKEIAKSISDEWKNLPDSEKRMYIEKYAPQIKKYREEIKSYKAEDKKIKEENKANAFSNKKNIDFHDAHQKKDKLKRGRPKKGRDENADDLKDEHLIFQFSEPMRSLPIIFEGMLNNKKIKITGTIEYSLNVTLAGQDKSNIL